MPSRRRLAELADLFLRNSFARQQNEQQAALQRETNRQKGLLDTQQQVLGRGLSDPMFAKRLLALSDHGASQLPPGFPAESLGRSDYELSAPMSGKIEGAKTIGEVPTLPDIVSFARTNGMDTDPVMSAQVVYPEDQSPEVLPSGHYGLQSQGPLQNLYDQRAGKVAGINRANEMADDRALAMAKGTAYNTKMGEEMANAEAFPAQLLRRGQQYQIDTQLETDRINQQAQPKANAAGLEADMRLGAEWLNPAIINAKVDLFRREEEIRASHRVPTDAESRAGGMAPLMMASNLGALGMESKGIGLNFGTQTFGNTPGLASFVNDEQKQYLQHAQNFLNIASLILTGVTARPDEYTRYASTYFALNGDDPATIAQKQKAREMFVKAVEARAHRNQPATLDEINNEVQGTLTNPRTQMMGDINKALGGN